MNDLIIQTENLRKAYGPKLAVAGVNLQVSRGEVFGFLGPNGAGKSTTVKMLLGLVLPSAGTVRVFGQSPQNSAVRAKIGFLPEHFRFHEWLKAREFLTFHGQLYGLTGPNLAKRVDELLDLVGLGQTAEVKLGNFSKGMLQRVGLAQAMLNQPELIFLDEPTSGLDPLGRRLVRDIIYQLRDAGTTVFLNSHLLSEIEVTCNRVAFIKQGTVVQAHSMAELAERDTRLTLRAEPLTATLLAELKTLDPALDHHGSTVMMHLTSESLVPQVAQMVLAQGASLFELRPERQSLEEIFVNIIGSDAGDGR